MLDEQPTLGEALVAAGQLPVFAEVSIVEFEYVRVSPRLALLARIVQQVSPK